MTRLTGLCLAVLIAGGASLAPRTDAPPPPSPRGDYLGQTPPGAEPALFAPGIVSTGLYDRDIALTPDGREIYFSVGGPGYAWMTILFSRRQPDASWTRPAAAPFTAALPATDIEPFVAPDGQRLYFVSDRARGEAPSATADHDIWFVERGTAGWGEPRNLGAPVNSPDEEYFPSLTRDGTIYFTREKRGEPAGFVYRSRRVEGGYAPPEKLPEAVNSGRARFNAFVAPDESYLILSIVGRPDAIGRSDYYVCFRSPDDNWSEPITLGERINVPRGEGYSPFVSPDGKYFFFMSRRRGAIEAMQGRRLEPADIARLGAEPENGNTDTYWVDASFIEALRPRR